MVRCAQLANISDAVVDTPTVRHPSPVRPNLLPSSPPHADQVFCQARCPPIPPSGFVFSSHASLAQELIAAFTAEADITKQRVMDFTCREHERFLVATEELFADVSESMASLVGKYAALARLRLNDDVDIKDARGMVSATPPSMPPSCPQQSPNTGAAADAGCRRPVRHSARIINQG